jgi:hypothetical protein
VEERYEWGAHGPWCLGGEYLPELLEGEVEIARISLKSTTSDQISVRARQQGGVIHYRIVGEYEEEGTGYALCIESTEEPLSLGELMVLINSASVAGDIYPGGILGSTWLMMSDSGYGRDEIIDFLSLSSAFYPEIGACYRELAETWVENNAEVDHV